MTTTREILRGAQPPLRRFWVGAMWGLLSATAAVALLATSGWLIVTASMVNTLVALNVAIVGVRFFATSRAVFRYLERLSGHDAALRQLATTRADLVRRLVPLSPDGLSRADRGSVLAALVDDVDELQNLPLRVVQPVVIGTLVSVGAVVFTAIVAPPAALTLALCLLLAAAAAIGWGWLAGARAERSIGAARAELAGALGDYFGAFDVLRAYGAEADARERIRRADEDLRRRLTRAASAQGASSAVLSGAAGLATLSAILVYAPSVTAPAQGAWLAVAALLPMAVFEVFGAVPLAAASWRRVRAAAARTAAALPNDIPAELVVDDEDAPSVDAPLGDGIRLRGVHAAWPGGADILRGADLDVRPGERVLVTGASGSGKSTLAHVLVRFLAHTGTYEVGGVDTREVSGVDVRRTIGLCEQQPMIFDENIRQNLLFARDTATDDELIAVLERVGLGDWLRRRGGLDARVGERGALLSGGQAQRLALARALLHEVDVLVLDEPTAGVDATQSDALLRDLLTAAPGRAVILISHVDVPEGLVDRTLRLHDGRLHPVG